MGACLDPPYKKKQPYQKSQIISSGSNKVVQQHESSLDATTNYLFNQKVDDPNNHKPNHLDLPGQQIQNLTQQQGKPKDLNAGLLKSEGVQLLVQTTQNNNSLSNKENNFKLEWDMTTSYADYYYQVKTQRDTTTLRFKDTQFNRCQITSKQPFPKEGIHILTIKILKQQAERAICIGLIAGSRKYCQSSGDIGDKQSLGYWTYTTGKGQIDINGKKHSKGGYQSIGCALGGQVQFELNMDIKKIIIARKPYKKNQYEELVPLDLPQSLQKCELYAFVSMIQKDDQIEVTYRKQ